MPVLESEQIELPKHTPAYDQNASSCALVKLLKYNFSFFAFLSLAFSSSLHFVPDFRYPNFSGLNWQRSCSSIKALLSLQLQQTGCSPRMLYQPRSMEHFKFRSPVPLRSQGTATACFSTLDCFPADLRLKQDNSPNAI